MDGIHIHIKTTMHTSTFLHPYLYVMGINIIYTHFEVP